MMDMKVMEGDSSELLPLTDWGVLVDEAQGGATIHVVGLEHGEAAELLRAAADTLAPPAEVVELSDVQGKQLGPFARESSTSRAAAIAAYPKQGTQRARILAALRLNEVTDGAPGPHGLTRDELAAELGLSPNTIRPRVVELRSGGWVRESEHTRKTDAGQDAALVELTEAARDELRVRAA